MVGPLAQVIALVAYGNDYLRNSTVPTGFDSVNTTFQYCNKVDFREVKKKFLSTKTEEKVIANSPTEWFEHLRDSGCKGLCLYYKHSKDQSFAKDHQSAGLVGRCGVWLIEALYDDSCDYWANRWEITKENDPDSKIWSVNYVMVAKQQQPFMMKNDEEIVKHKLRQTLAEIADFAHKHDLKHWAEQFVNSKAILDSDLPNKKCYNKDLVPLNNYSLTAQQILFSAGSALVFGGMGSWNDLGIESKADKSIYDRLSEQLYSNIVDAIIAGINKI